jgi:leucine dehydrogenase
VINCYAEVKGLTSEWAMGKAQEIFDTTLNILNRSITNNVPTYKIANQMAEERIEAIGKVKLPM